MRYQTRLFASSSPDATGPTIWRRRSGGFSCAPFCLRSRRHLSSQRRGPSRRGRPRSSTTTWSPTPISASPSPGPAPIPIGSGIKYTTRLILQAVSTSKNNTLSPVANGAWGDSISTSFIQGTKTMLLSWSSATRSPQPVLRRAEHQRGGLRPRRLENIRFEMEFHMSQLVVPGIFWAMTSEDDTNFPPENKAPADGYVFYLEPTNPINGFRNAYSCTTSSTPIYPETQVRWNIARTAGLRQKDAPFRVRRTGCTWRGT